MVELEDIKTAYYVARGNKRRSADSVEYEINLEANLTQLVSDINNRTLRPTAYTFVTLKPRPREIFACEMGMRVIHHYIDIRLRPLIENRLTTRTFNNRKGYGANSAIQQVIDDVFEVTNGYSTDAYIIKLDLKGYFPNANLDIIYGQLSNLVEEDYFGKDKDDLLWLIERAVYSYPTKHCYRKSQIWKWTYISNDKSLFCKPDGIGGAIGHLLFQNAMNYYLNDFDHYVIDTLGLHYVRFVDDMLFVVQNKDAFLSYIEIFRKMLNEYGCEVHPTKFYCQHYSKGVEFIGGIIKFDRVYLTDRMIRNFQLKIKDFNRCARVSKIESFISSANSYLGICKTRNGYAVARNMIDRINAEWWQFVHFDNNRCCIVANEGYKHRDIINRKYRLHGRKKRDAHKRAICRHPQGRCAAERNRV